MERGELLGYAAWLALATGYADVVWRLGRSARQPPARRSEVRPTLTLVRSAGRHPAPRPAVATDPRRSMTITSLLTPELVLPALPPLAKADVLETLAAHVARAHPHVAARELADALHERERQSTTALENGVAVPHARVAGLPAPLAALARCPSGVACDAPDGRPTRLFLLFVAPAERPGSHLKLLAKAARLLSDARCRAALLEAPSAALLLAVLREHEERAERHVRAA